MILEVDWIAKLGDIRMNLMKGIFVVEYEGKKCEIVE